MVKKTLFLAMATIILFYTAGAYAESSNVPSKKTRDRASRVMDSLLPGPPEISYIKGSPEARGTSDDRCACKKKNNEVEKAIVSVVGGVWKIATFWCPDTGCQSSAPSDNAMNQ